jgi:hypothetical protein
MAQMLRPNPQVKGFYQTILDDVNCPVTIPDSITRRGEAFGRKILYRMGE